MSIFKVHGKMLTDRSFPVEIMFVERSEKTERTKELYPIENVIYYYSN